jgi:tetrahydromethanopterin S-methyltransferase subunit G
MSPVADDFAAISKRLKEIEQEVAAEAAARNQRREPERLSDSQDAYADIAACN